MADPRRKDPGDPAVAIEGLLDLARSGMTGGDPLPAQRDPSFAAVRGRLVGRQVHPRVARWRWALVAAPALLLLVGGVGLLVPAVRPAELSYVVEGATVAEGGYLRARADAEAELAFSDGTRVELARSSSGRVTWTGPRGARVLLDRGQARVRVVPRARGDGQWLFDAGPCRLEVKGTRFDMRWSPEDQQLDVRLHSGSGVVRGPAAPNGVLMQAGQRLVMDVRGNATRLLPLLADAPADEAAVAPEAPAAVPEPAELPPAPAPVPDRRPAPALDWSAQVLAGDFAAVLRDARRRGLGQVLDRAPAADVMALAEAARLSRQDALARRSLGVLVGRFPRSPQGDKARFLLGRMAEDLDGDLPAALRLYDDYLRAAPAGPYRDEALGRQMTATLKLAGADRARPLAAAYLRRYPQGAYAAPARAILERTP